MKIAIFTDTYLPDKNGVSTSIKQLKEGLKKRGHEIHIFCPKTGATPEEDNIYKYFCIKISKKVDGGFAFPNKKQIKNLIGKIQPDIIHTHSEFSMGRVGKIIGLEYKIKIVHTSHTMWDHYLHYVGILKHFINLDKIMGKFYSDIHHFIYPSNKAKDRYFHLAKNSNYKIIPNGIDREIFIKELTNQKKEEIFKKNNIKDNEKIIIFVGRINKEKNIKNLIINLKELLTKNRNYKILIVGRGEEEKTIMNFGLKNDIEKQIIITGAIPWNEIFYYYKISDVFASISFSESTYTMTLMEALTAGIPAVLINDKIYHNIIKNGINGYLVDKPENIGIYIEKIIKNKETLKTFKKNANETSKNFSNFVTNIENYYKEIISKK